ncbi:uncharacterized protein LOC100115141 isoform X3 [Nasonia vitripennis]|uniref:Uncharacterized protein n=1 Tax=Nasonia vitripennis TaxID=7425 RepID=A0A7M7Q5U2_NASVI|nr:uncharacterized protein LOC100115141 isoform X3 [Nasonia vitripennis]
MPQCAVATCRNSHRRTRGRRIRYHRFPQIPEVRSRWVRACGRVPLSNGDIPFNIQTARICSLHFTNDSYEKDMEHLVLGLPVRSRLRRGAVPTIGVPVNVQPVTKMLVEDAKRSLLKVAHAKMLKQGKAGAKGAPPDGKKPAKNNNNNNNNAAAAAAAAAAATAGGALAAEEIDGIDVLLALGLKPASHLNKMHAMDSSGGGNGKNALESGGPSELKQRDDEDSRKSPKVPQSQQNGAALPEETASADRNLVQCVAASGLPAKKEKKEPLDDAEANLHVQSPTRKSSKLQAEQPTTSPGKAGRPSGQRGAPAKLQLDEQQQQQPHCRETRKRRSAESAAAPASLSANGSGPPKKLCLDQREQFINSLIGSDKYTAEQLASRAEQLRAEVQELDELARAKEMEWNEILSMRKLKEEAYLRIERRRQIMGFMEGNGPLGAEGLMPPASLCLAQQHLDASNSQREPKLLVVPKEERSRDSSPAFKRERASKAQPSYLQPGRPQQLGENGPKMQQAVDAQSPEHRQIGEGRQGPIVDVRSIIADYRLRHPETVPRRRGRRMRNSVNVGLGAGGAMVETVGNMDSRPSSTDSCKSNSNLSDPNNAMSFKDVLVQFAKLSQQQGEPIKTPQNYPDVTLHPVAATPTTQNSAPQTGSGSLLHGILTKSQSPRPTTFSPTLARLLTAPERERSAPAITPTPHQSAQHLLQAYQGANPVSISDFLSSSKARTEITITPVVNNPLPTHANNLIHVDDGEDETSIIEERDSRLPMGARDNADDRDSPPRCQGCHERAAQFVCAGCGNQWYCSRECQVAAWDDHSEVCSG